MKSNAQYAKEARLRGDKTFYTGKSCLRGHYSERLASNAACCECKKEDKVKEHLSRFLFEFPLLADSLKRNGRSFKEQVAWMRLKGACNRMDGVFDA
ncbi:hypothetical protein VrSk94_33750 [Vibrio rotiferianus]